MARTFNMKVKDKNGTIAQQEYTVSSRDDVIKIGGFTIKKVSGEWKLSFSNVPTPPTPAYLTNIAKEIAVSSEINTSTGIVTIPLESVKIDTMGNVVFKLKPDSHRAVGDIQEFEITPNSFKYKSGGVKKEIKACETGKAMNVELPKNFIELFMSKDHADSTITSLPIEFFHAIVDDSIAATKSFSDLTSGNAEVLTITNQDGKKMNALKVVDSTGKTKLYVGSKTKVREADLAHFVNAAGQECLAFIFDSGATYATVLPFSNVDAAEQANLCRHMGISPADWSSNKHILNATNPLYRLIGNKDIKEFSSSREKSTSVLADPTFPLASIIEEDPATHEIIINGVNTGVSCKGEDGEDAEMPHVDPTDGMWIDGNGNKTTVRAWDNDGNVPPAIEISKDGDFYSYPSGTSPNTFRWKGEEGKIAELPYRDSTTGNWVINGQDTGLDAATTKIAVDPATKQWKSVNSAGAMVDIVGLTNKSAVGEKGQNGQVATINPTTKCFEFNTPPDPAKTTSDWNAEADFTATKITIDPTTHHLFVDGADMGLCTQTGADGMLPLIDLNHKYWIKNVKTNYTAESNKHERHPQPEVDSSGNIVIGGEAFPFSIGGKEGPLPEVPSVADDGNWIINGQNTGLNAKTTKITVDPLKMEWKSVDSSGAMVDIAGLTNKSCLGPKGEDGVSPTIGSNGNFFLGGTDTNHPAVWKEQEKSKDSPTKNKLSDFYATPFFYGLGLLALVFGVLSGMVGLIALAALAFATPKLTQNMIDDYNKYAKPTLSDKIKSSKEKRQERAKIKAKNRALKRHKNALLTDARRATLDADKVNAIKDNLFDSTGRKINKDVLKELEKMNVAHLINKDKIQQHHDELQNRIDYFNDLKAKYESEISDAAKLAEFNRLYGDVMTNLQIAQAANEPMMKLVENIDSIKLMNVFEKSSITPEIVAYMTDVLDIPLNCLFDGGKTLDEDASIKARLKDKLQEKYEKYVNGDIALGSTTEKYSVFVSRTGKLGKDTNNLLELARRDSIEVDKSSSGKEPNELST